MSDQESLVSELGPQPGPELDRLIAEGVMGWERMSDYWADEHGFRGWIEIPSNIPHDWEIIWSPSTRIEHAWEVVEKVGLLNWPNSLQHGNLDGLWTIERFTGETTDIIAQAETAPLAICLAALKMIGG